ncbi:hypothetical protein M438DRAFT_347879 [Aureobasidium pullulans EXF-150]|uniref:Uncharacterized protein n=1 Tax=Aureobasidium pullulans EXF-150 TaxID=1043002 RepID=A0A074Y4G0_AURPU|nr:uncharacterized protein M438DRAFT_347879 [Aureobasidium pullulans EXF-150]KEQ81801.1 hypothetical protein M438DRAFT_347879 [Aureobasidium pullulans EXF-150]
MGGIDFSTTSISPHNKCFADGVFMITIGESTCYNLITRKCLASSSVLFGSCSIYFICLVFDGATHPGFRLERWLRSSHAP